ASALRFELDLAENLTRLGEELGSGAYRPSRSVCFVNERPKPREIFAADFRDRVVHHLFVREVEPYWERVFVHDSYASRRGKGTHAAVDRLARFVRQATRGGRRRAWFLQLDVANFFMSIDKRILFERIDRGLKRQYRVPDATLPLFCEEYTRYLAFRDLARVLIFHDPTERYVRKSPTDKWRLVPGHKSLLNRPPGKGLPIGNLTSQFFANVYLDALDQFAKHELKARRYVRYVDDLVLVHESREALVGWKREIEGFLGRELGLALNERRTRLRPVSSGIDFLGYVVHPTHRLVRRRVVGNLRASLDGFEGRLARARRDGTRALASTADEHDRLVATINSYLAHFAKADARKLTASLWRRHGWLGFFVGPDGHRVFRRDRPRRIPAGFRKQYRWFARRAGGGALFFQAGRYFELYDGQARDFGPLLGLREIAPRPGFSRRCGFHRRYLKRYVDKAREAGLPVTVVRETRRRGAKVKERRIAQRRGPFADCPPKPSAVVSRPGRRRDSVSGRSIDCRLSASAGPTAGPSTFEGRKTAP
ncbi:MAG: RNA-directed DNA polymerase, partial [Polyangia bacterium]